MRFLKNCLLALCVFLSTGIAMAAELRADMDTANALWLSAFNGNKPAEFTNLYTSDAVLMPPGAGPVNGNASIAKFWGDRITAFNLTNHAFEVLGVTQDGNTAYLVCRFTVDAAKDGKALKFAGNSVRVYERNAEGIWRIKVHIYTRD